MVLALAVSACGSDFEPAGIVVPQTAGAGGSVATGGSTAVAGATGGSAGGASTAGAGAAQVPDASDLPCGVAELLRARCLECHGYPIRGGAPMRLLERADLLAAARSDARQRVVDKVLARIADAARPMPPPPRARVGDAELAAVQAWVDDGTPPGSCPTVR